MLRAGVVKNRIGVISGRLHFCDGCELVEIKDGHRSAAPVADEAAMEVGRQRDSVHTLGLGNRSDDLALVDIDDFDTIAVRHEQPARCAVDAAGVGRADHHGAGHGPRPRRPQDQSAPAGVRRPRAA